VTASSKGDSDQPVAAESNDEKEWVGLYRPIYHPIHRPIYHPIYRPIYRPVVVIPPPVIIPRPIVPVYRPVYRPPVLRGWEASAAMTANDDEKMAKEWVAAGQGPRGGTVVAAGPPRHRRWEDEHP
jgi:hypothetical protein